MGSVGVYTGRLTGSQFGAFLSDATGKTKRFGNITDGRGVFPDKIVVRNEDNSYSYTINFSNMRLPKRFQNAGRARRRLEIEKRKDAYLRALRQPVNVDNSQATYNRVYNQAIAQGKTEKQATDLAQRARSKIAMDVAKQVRNEAKFRKMGISITSRRKL